MYKWLLLVITLVTSTAQAQSVVGTVTQAVPNVGSTGTTLNALAKLTGAPSTAVITATTDTSGILGVVVGGAGTSGNALIAVQGQASCIFDGATTAGDYVTNSTTTNGECHDAGSSYPNPGGNDVIGRVLSTNASGGTYALIVFSPEQRSSTNASAPQIYTIVSTSATTCNFPSGSSACNNGTFTVPSGAMWLEVTLLGDGGGGAGGGTSWNAGSAGGGTCWNTSGSACTSPVYEAGGGAGAPNNGNGGVGGTLSGSATCAVAAAGSAGMGGTGGASGVSTSGGVGGASSLGGSGRSIFNGAGGNGQPNTGGGGGGGGSAGASTASGGGGGSGATCKFTISAPASTYTYAAGSGGNGGTAGTNGFAGGNGANGQIIITAYFNY